MPIDGMTKEEYKKLRAEIDRRVAAGEVTVCPPGKRSLEEDDVIKSVRKHQWYRPQKTMKRPLKTC